MPYASLFGRGEATSELRAFVEAMPDAAAGRPAAFAGGRGEGHAGAPAYVFSNDAASEAIVAALLPPPAGLPRWLGEYDADFALLAPQFYLGPPLSGSPDHFHGPAINGLAFGAKLWRLKPPWRADYSSVPAFAAFQRADPGARACVQRAGDVLFVPNNWGHAVLNLETAVGVAAELTFLD